MVVFVTLILGASAASALFIETSYELSGESADIAAEAILEISNSLRVVSAYAFYNGSSGLVESIRVTFSLGLGSPPINLNGIVLEISDVTEIRSLGMNQTRGLNFIMIRDQDGSMENSTLNVGDLARLEIDGDFSPGEKIDLRFEFSPRGSCITRITIPDPLMDRVTRIV